MQDILYWKRKNDLCKSKRHLAQVRRTLGADCKQWWEDGIDNDGKIACQPQGKQAIVGNRGKIQYEAECTRTL